MIFGTSELGVFREVYNVTKMKMNRNFNMFTDFESLELEVPTFYLVTGYVSARSDSRYVKSFVRREVSCL